MYPEFVAIYIGLGVLFIMLLVILILLIVVLKKVGKGSAAKNGRYSGIQYQAPQASGTAFCRRCGTKFDSSMNACPQCGTQR